MIMTLPLYVFSISDEQNLFQLHWIIVSSLIIHINIVLRVHKSLYNGSYKYDMVRYDWIKLINKNK